MQASAQAVLAVFELRQAYDQVGAMAASALALAADGVNIALDAVGAAEAAEVGRVSAVEEAERIRQERSADIAAARNLLQIAEDQGAEMRRQLEGMQAALAHEQTKSGRQLEGMQAALAHEQTKSAPPPLSLTIDVQLYVCKSRQQWP